MAPPLTTTADEDAVAEDDVEDVEDVAAVMAGIVVVAVDLEHMSIEYQAQLVL